jgi:3-oxoadipate enol-lactonase
MPLLATNGTHLWVDQCGQGPDVVFVAGLADDGQSWAEQVASLADRYRVTTFDNRAVGHSDTPDGPYRILDFVTDTVELLDVLGVDRASIIGSSMGGAIAQEIAIRYPDRVKDLVLHGTWSRTDEYFRAVIKNWQALAVSGLSKNEFFEYCNVWFFAPSSYESGLVHNLALDVSENPDAQTPEQFCLQAEALLTHDTTQRLHTISARTLVTVGELDITTPLSSAQRIVQEIGGATLHVFNGLGHMSYIESPAEFTATISSFLDEGR